MKLSKIRREPLTAGIDRKLIEAEKQVRSAVDQYLKPALRMAGQLASYPISRAKALVSNKYCGPLADLWAIDIGTGGIKMARLMKQEDGSYAVRDYYRETYSDIPDLSAQPEHLHAIRVESLKDMLARANVEKKDIVIAISGNSVFTRQRTLPPVSQEKVKELAGYDIKQQIPFDLSDIYWDCQVLSRTPDGCYEVLMAAVKKSVLDDYLKVCEEAGCTVHSVTTNAFAGFNWHGFEFVFTEFVAPVATIDIGAETTEIVCVVDGEFRFTRPLKWGGYDVTKAYASAHTYVSYEEAELNKKLISPDPSNMEGNELIYEALERLASEVNRSLAYFKSLPGGAEIKEVILTGGGSLLQGLDSYLKDKLGIPVKNASEFFCLSGDGRKGDLINAYQMSAVLGLALACHQEVPIDINLLSE